MPGRDSYNYAIIRVVPHVERQEFVNVGVILFCRTMDYLDALIDLDLDRLRVLAPNADIALVRSQLDVIKMVCAGGSQAGYFADWSKSERFHWLVAPSSTIIQTSPVHTGLCDDPSAALQELYRLFVT